MLDTETRRRIDTARDILVGKVPDPKSQVEQITIALIYKFMDDMDAKAEEYGGERQFFAGDFAQYGWASLMHGGLSGHDVLNLYAIAITRMPENPGIPPLFRDIFNNAYLPYRNPETLRAFLKVIDEFTYDHSERLGDAFEYLLSVLGSQGDAGQFRTPRHIIDFIVAIIDPKKDETILDPACGTAGFLISSWKHIAEANTDEKGSNTLSPVERERLAENLSGYDISPDMVRLSLVNMYLHRIMQPRVYEYDTLTSEDKWTEYADVILANPPFMSPKGGIRPHNRFSVQSKRSEVLFVDYMAEHLSPEGRAGIIVPEGIIFQSQNAYRQLRRMLVEDYLVAVISLPAGVFNPYSGVKTSILILDRKLAKQTDHIAFYKVENDGFDLGAQRREIEKNDLPMVRDELCRYLEQSRAGKRPTPSESESDANVAEQGVEYAKEPFKSVLGLVVEKEKIAADGEYNLGGERYRVDIDKELTYALVSLGDSELFQIVSGGTPKSKVSEYWDGGVPWATLADLPPTDFISDIKTTERTISASGLANSSARMIPENSVIVSTRATIGRIGINRIPLATNQGFKNIIIKNPLRAMSAFVALAVTKLVPTMNAWASGGTFKEISKSRFCDLQIPLPPLNVQEEIVAEVEGYQRVIDGAQAVIDHYEPRIRIDPEWPVVKLGDVCEVLDKLRKPITKSDRIAGPYPYYGATGIVDWVADYIFDEPLVLIGEDGAKWGAGEQSAFAIEGKAWVNNHAHVLRTDFESVINWFLITILNQYDLTPYISGVTVPKLNQRMLNSIPIPLPTMETQVSIVKELCVEKTLVANNQTLVKSMEKKIAKTIGQVWDSDITSESARRQYLD